MSGKRFSEMTDAEVRELAGAGRGRGRPAVGPAVLVRFEPELLAAIDAYAAARRISRAAAVRELTGAGLAEVRPL